MTKGGYSIISQQMYSHDFGAKLLLGHAILCMHTTLCAATYQLVLKLVIE